MLAGFSEFAFGHSEAAVNPTLQEKLEEYEYLLGEAQYYKESGKAAEARRSQKKAEILKKEIDSLKKTEEPAEIDYRQYNPKIAAVLQAGKLRKDMMAEFDKEDEAKKKWAAEHPAAPPTPLQLRRKAFLHEAQQKFLAGVGDAARAKANEAAHIASQHAAAAVDAQERRDNHLRISESAAAAKYYDQAHMFNKQADREVENAKQAYQDYVSKNIGLIQ